MLSLYLTAITSSPTQCYYTVWRINLTDSFTSQGVGPRQGTAEPRWVPGLWQRSKGEIHPTKTWHEPPAETHEARLVRLAATVMYSLFSNSICCCLKSVIRLWQGWPRRRPLPWWIWLGLRWWRGAQLWPTAALGPSWLAPHAASSRYSHPGKVRDG